jgi:hypothetical protein
MLVLAAWAVSLALGLLLLRKCRAQRPNDDVLQWIQGQKKVANFRSTKTTGLRERLQLRAEPNSRLITAFGIDNSLTTSCPLAHRAFVKTAKRLLDKNRSWEKVYSVAMSFLETEVQNTITKSPHKLPLAECVRCMCLVVVLFDNFGIDPADIPTEDLVTITSEINNQWLLSKCDQGVTRSALLDTTIASMNLTLPSPSPNESVAAQVLSLIMPQYETLWRVVLLTFVTAYHHQPRTSADAIKRTADVPSCLGKPELEKEALKLAMASFLKPLPPTPTPTQMIHLLTPILL